jgi:hypothetical protein
MALVRIDAVSKAFLEHIITNAGASIAGGQPWEKDSLGVLIGERLIEPQGRQVVVTKRGLEFFQRALMETENGHIFYVGDPDVA